MRAPEPRKPGRPKTGRELRERYTTTLRPSVAELLRALGDGNLSAGIERAAALAGSGVQGAAE